MITVHKLTKKIRAADGTYRTLVSYDGINWGLDQSRALTRFKRGAQLHPKLKKAAVDRIESAVDNKRGRPKNANEKGSPFLITKVATTRFTKASGKKSHKPLPIHRNRKLRHVKR